MKSRGMKVGELARHAAVTAETIRHYTDKGLLRPKRDSTNGYKIYRVADVSRVRFICQAKQLGFSLAEISRILSHADKGKSPCPEVRDMIQAKIDENRRRLIEIETLQTRMEKALSQWRDMPDKIPDGDSICHLIESVAGINEGT